MTSFISSDIVQAANGQILSIQTDLHNLNTGMENTRNLIDSLTQKINGLTSLSIAFQETIHGGDEFGKGTVVNILTAAGVSSEDLEKLFPTDGTQPVAVDTSGQNIYDILTSLQTARDVASERYSNILNEIDSKNHVLSAVKALYSDTAASIIAQYFYDLGLDENFLKTHFPGYVIPTTSPTTSNT